MNFASLGIHSLLTECLNDLNYKTPTPIQSAAIPAVLSGEDIMAGAQTGTGKTAAFALPILHSLLERDEVDNLAIKALVLVPTRELAQQVYSSFVKYSANTAIKSVVAYGGASINPQLHALKQGCSIIIATPGRLLELLIKELISLDKLTTFVLDEADRMLDMGFIIDIKKVCRYLPEQKQTLLFSATFNDDIFAVSKSLLNTPVLIEVDQRNVAASKVEQWVYQVDQNRKSALLAYLIGSKNWHQVLVFTRTKLGADALAKELPKDGITAQAIHGDKAQGARDRILADFKEGKTRVLVATDVAARGIDIQSLKYVVNHELPYNAEDYIHRIGRTGRAGSTGIAVSLVSTKEQYLLDDIEKLLNEHFSPQWMPGFEPSQKEESADQKKRTPSKRTLRAKALNGSKSDKKRPNRRVQTKR